MHITPIQNETIPFELIQKERYESNITIKDSISPNSVEKEVPATTKLTTNFGILVIDYYLKEYYLISKVKQKILGLSNEEKLLCELKKFCDEKKDKELHQFIHFLNREAKHNRDDLKELLLEIFQIKEFHPYLREIFHGANIKLIDGGSLFHKWKKNPLVYSRASSHDHQPGECYAYSHAVFWLDSEGNTRFQLENTPLTGIFNRLVHLIDYLKYINTKEQQGIIGTSIYTENNPIVIGIEKK